MFYCGPCGQVKGWPDSRPWGSYGRCEVCGTPDDCSDVPSKHLRTIYDITPQPVEGEAEAIESIKQALATAKCPGCGTRGADPHEENDEICREIQYERAYKNREDL